MSKIVLFFFSIRSHLFVFLSFVLLFLEGVILPVICGVLSALVIFLVVGVAVICFERRKNKTKQKGTKLAFQSPHSDWPFALLVDIQNHIFLLFFEDTFCFLADDFFIMSSYFIEICGYC